MDPTASAVLGDVIDAAVNLLKGTHGSLGTFSRARIRPIDETSAEYLLNLEVDDRPGVLHAVTGVFARNDVSIRAAEQEGNGPEARLVFITHEARESAVQATVRELRDLAVGAPGRQPAARDRQLSPMRYVSTRGTAPTLGFADVLLAGLAIDGGLYVPETWPSLPPALEGATYAERAAQVMAPFVDDDCGLDDETLAAAVPRGLRARSATRRSSRSSRSATGTSLQELFHGPTLAFKDVALQLVGRLFDHVLGRARRAGHHRRGDERRHRLGGDRRRQGLRQRRHRHPLPRRAGERGAAPADDHGRRAERAHSSPSRARSTTARTS